MHRPCQNLFKVDVDVSGLAGLLVVAPYLPVPNPELIVGRCYSLLLLLMLPVLTLEMLMPLATATSENLNVI